MTRDANGPTVVVAPLLLLLAGCAFHFGFVAWLAHAIVQAPNSAKPVVPDEDPGPAEISRLGVDRQLRVEVGPPPASLSVWVIEARAGARRAPRGTVFVLHGIRDRKDSVLGFGKLLAAGGYRAVLVDLRGHGRSSGDWLTYGVVESRDLKQLAEWLERERLLASPLGAYGASYGGAVALQWAALDPRVRAVVTVATFASAREEVSDYIRSLAPRGLPPEVTIGQAFRKATLLTSAPLDRANPVEAIQKTQAACLLLHGKADARIPVRHALELSAAGRGHSRLLVLEGEDHDTIFADRQGVIARETLAWFDRWLADGDR